MEVFCRSSSLTFKDNSVRQETKQETGERWQPHGKRLKKKYQGLHYLVSKSREKDMAQWQRSHCIGIILSGFFL